MKVIISGGGTGGHIFPALSIANEIRQRHPEVEILFVGAENRMEMERVPKAGYKIVGLPVMGFDRKKLWLNFKVIAKLYSSMRKARRIVRDFKPDIAVGVGGYASGPTLKAAQRFGVPTLLQEQNSYAGVTNKMLSKKAKAICVAYDNMNRFVPEGVIVKTGNPVRADILDCKLTQSEAKRAMGFSEDRPLVLVIGGSLGSLTVNNAIKASLVSLRQNNISVLWQTGKYYSENCKKAVEGFDNVKAEAFIDDMATAYRAADLIVSRAGASTISELQLLGKPAVLIPSPNVAEDHQRKNAMALVDKDAAVMILDADAVEKLPETIVSLLENPARLETMSHKIKAMALPDSASKIVDRIENIIANK